MAPGLKSEQLYLYLPRTVYRGKLALFNSLLTELRAADGQLANSLSS